MSIRQALLEGAPSLEKHRAAADEIARLDAQVLGLEKQVEALLEMLAAATTRLKDLRGIQIGSVEQED